MAGVRSIPCTSDHGLTFSSARFVHSSESCADLSLTLTSTWHLLQVSSWYTVVIFTASLPEYADPVIDWLDGGDGRGGMVGARLFRAVRWLRQNTECVKNLADVLRARRRTVWLATAPT